MKVQNLLFIKYSNYANRLIKPIGTYMTDYYNPGDDVLEVAKVSFHQGNGIYAEQIVTTDFTSFVYNYLLTSDNDDATLKVVTRWFVIGKEDLRNGQVRVSLKRDLISDYFNDVVSADFMMERGNLDFGKVGATSDTRLPDPLIFLPEEQSYNQVKKSSTKLYRFNANEPAWIVGYVPKNIEGYQSVSIDAVPSVGKTWGIEFSKSKIQKNNDDAFDVIAMPYADVNFDKTVGGTVTAYKNTKELSLKIMTALAAKGILYDLQLVPYLTGMGDEMTIDTDGDIICGSTNFATPNDGYDTDNHCELMEFGIHVGKYPGDIPLSRSSSSNIASIPSDWGNGNLVSVVYVNDSQAEFIAWMASALKGGQIADNRYILVSGSDYTYSGGVITFGTGNIVTHLLSLMDQGFGHLEITYKETSATPINVHPIIVSLPHSEETFSFSRSASAFTGISGAAIQMNDLKYAKEIYRHRLVSPNHASIFEWSPSLNYTFYKTNSTTTAFVCNIYSYQVALDLKPFDPYIRVQPQFHNVNYGNGTVYSDGLYGGNYYDARGLVCEGDFSLTMPTSAWENYKLNNKTFASSFARQITSLELSHEAQTSKDAASLIVSTVLGGVALGMKGGAAGAAIGAVGGLVTGLLSAGYNYEIREDNINKTKAQFNMSLQSIQARPDALTKVGPLDPDNDIWPTVETYEATGVEQSQFLKRMQMTGMAAHKATTISGQMTDTTIVYPRTVDGSTYQYFSGTIIQMDESTEATSAMIDEINRELQLGLYFATSLF